MNTRCPAWCDRVLMSPSAKELILRVSEAWRAGGGAGRLGAGRPGGRAWPGGSLLPPARSPRAGMQPRFWGQNSVNCRSPGRQESFQFIACSEKSMGSCPRKSS